MIKNEKLMFHFPCLSCCLRNHFLFLKCNDHYWFFLTEKNKQKKTDDNPGICWRWGAPCRLSWAGGRSVPWARGTTHTGSPPHHWRSPTRRPPTAANGRVRTLRTDTHMTNAYLHMDKQMKLNVGKIITCFLNSLLIRKFLSTGHLVIWWTHHISVNITRSSIFG